MIVIFWLSQFKIKRRKEVVTGNLEPGDSFGEKSLVANEPFEQSVVSQTPLLIAVIDVEDLKGNFDRHPLQHSF